MSDTQAIKDRIDIVALIGEYVPLKKSGANWKGRCPFHNEKTPSFMVARDRQMWHCFGCSKGGDVFTFIEEMEGLDFVGALKLLADKAGVVLDTSFTKTDQSGRNRALQVLEAAADFYHKFLIELPASEPARTYLAKRGLSNETINEWQIGFITDQWDLLTKYLMKKGFGVDDLVGAGLTIMREGADPRSGRGYYDRFRGRIMFPICDAHGSVVGFTGRILVETPETGGKYVNTPETVVYDKSKVLFGLSKAKTEMKVKNLAVVVEGQMDVIACHQAGMKNVIAASGTALTADQVRLIKRYTENIAMAFDADKAGENAGKRGIATALGEGMNVKVIQLAEGVGKDASEAIQKNPAGWFAAVQGAREVMDWFFDRAFNGKDLSKAPVKRSVASELLPHIKSISYAVEREHWLSILSDKLGIDIAVLRDELKNTKMNSTEPKALRPASPAPVATTSQNDPELLLETEWWSLLIKFPSLYPEFHAELRTEYFTGTAYSMLYEKVKDLYTSIGALDVSALHQSYDTGSENFIDVLLMRPYRDRDDLGESQAREELKALLPRLKRQWAKKRGKEIEHDIAAAEASGDSVLVGALVSELEQLNALIR